MMNFQLIADLASICSLKGVRNVILSPGSRCAPLTLAFVRHPDITTRTISDERSAAFIGLGIALKTKLPVALVCTSGSAALNYFPAIAEAYFQQVPLLVFTADRPEEWIDQLDGQTIRQTNVYGRHVKKSFSLPTTSEHPDQQWQIHRIISEAINESTSFPPGPVHLNVPFREPFYPEPDTYIFHNKIKIINEIHSEHSDVNALKEFVDYFESFKKILIVAGQNRLEPDLISILSLLTMDLKIPIVSDITTNLHQVTSAIKRQDTFLDRLPSNDLKPELLITFGKSCISKNLKLFLRTNKPQVHWHIQSAGAVADTFQSLTQIIRSNPKELFNALLESKKVSGRSSFKKAWTSEDIKIDSLFNSIFDDEYFSELEAVKKIMESLPDNSDLHLANSMSVRYANLIGLNEDQTVEVFCNRGTSGIDGSTSTAVGTSLESNQITTLITGDMAFFYDRNAFWNNYIPINLRIIVLNNHGGIIFGMIDGPSQQPELEEYFETDQRLSAKLTASEFDLEYINCTQRENLESALKHFFQKGKKAKILEIEIDKKITKKVFNKLKNKTRKI